MRTLAQAIGDHLPYELALRAAEFARSCSAQRDHRARRRLRAAGDGDRRGVVEAKWGSSEDVAQGLDVDLRDCVLAARRAEQRERDARSRQALWARAWSSSMTDQCQTATSR